MYKRSCIR